jgi:hypothetical protein
MEVKKPHYFIPTEDFVESTIYATKKKGTDLLDLVDEQYGLAADMAMVGVVMDHEFGGQKNRPRTDISSRGDNDQISVISTIAREMRGEIDKQKELIEGFEGLTSHDYYALAQAKFWGEDDIPRPRTLISDKPALLKAAKEFGISTVGRDQMVDMLEKDGRLSKKEATLMKAGMNARQLETQRIQKFTVPAPSKDKPSPSLDFD